MNIVFLLLWGHSCYGETSILHSIYCRDIQFQDTDTQYLPGMAQPVRYSLFQDFLIKKDKPLMDPRLIKVIKKRKMTILIDCDMYLNSRNIFREMQHFLGISNQKRKLFIKVRMIGVLYLLKQIKRIKTKCLYEWSCL